ncbi:hypothetical protein TorRG33x02_155580 [Trema orientale]|uniref:Uncharacterized protein n=1 Tax=Trema orientale TaxID=63057 RepID=A0A2P5ET07_TREOI|nr:hypothetical protein TorRG33x02_155580 [Trema orientale]
MYVNAKTGGQSCMRNNNKLFSDIVASEEAIKSCWATLLALSYVVRVNNPALFDERQNQLKKLEIYVTVVSRHESFHQRLFQINALL